MIEQNAYLSEIFGEKALRIHTQESEEGIIIGNFHRQDAISPLNDVIYQENGMVHLQVAPEHLAGHFSKPATLPAYRMIELGTMKADGSRVSHVSNAIFQRIIKPGDEIVASRIEERVFIARDINQQYQGVAGMEVGFSHSGLSPHEIGMMLEVAAQTMAANLIKKTEGKDLLYPLIRRVDHIMIFDTEQAENLIIVPTALGSFAKRNRFVKPTRFYASADILDSEHNLKARVEHVHFEFASEKAIGTYDELGRNF